jgi:hypothetical protein
MLRPPLNKCLSIAIERLWLRIIATVSGYAGAPPMDDYGLYQ